MSLLGFSEAKFKAQLKMAIQRIKLVNNKIENEVKRLKRAIAGLLNKPQKEEEKAKIKCEHLIRGDHTVAAHCVLELMCEALIARVKLISQTKKCPEDLLQAVSTIIYCSSRVDIPELKKIQKMLQMKYKKSFVKRAIVNADYNVNTTVIQKLNLSNPKEGMVRNYLKAIASEYGFVWEPQEEKDAMGMVEGPIGRDVNPAAATGFTNQYGSDGAPIIYNVPPPRAHVGLDPGMHMGVGMGMDMGVNQGTVNIGNMNYPHGMLPGPPPPQQQQQQQLQFDQQQVARQPNFEQQQQQLYQQQIHNPAMVGTFGTNPKVKNEEQSSIFPTSYPEDKNDWTNSRAQILNLFRPLETFLETVKDVPPEFRSSLARLRDSVQQYGSTISSSQLQKSSDSSQIAQQMSSLSLPGPPPSTGYVVKSPILPPPQPNICTTNNNHNASPTTDDFEIPMAPNGIPRDDSDIPPPPSSNYQNNSMNSDSTNAGNVDPTTSGANENGAAPGMEELLARFNNLMQ